MTRFQRTKTRGSRRLGAILGALFANLWFTAGSLEAEQFGLFTYRVEPGLVEITNYPTTEVGAVEIPAVIDGKQVTSIGGSAFSGHGNPRHPHFTGAETPGITDSCLPSPITGLGYW